MVVDLAEIENSSLYRFVGSTAMVFYDAEVAVILAVFFAMDAAQSMPRVDCQKLWCRGKVSRGQKFCIAPELMLPFCLVSKAQRIALVVYPWTPVNHGRELAIRIADRSSISVVVCLGARSTTRATRRRAEPPGREGSPGPS